MRIPDMTERFPEGMNGEDRTSDYFPLENSPRDGAYDIDYDTMHLDSTVMVDYIIEEYGVDRDVAEEISQVRIDTQDAIYKLECSQEYHIQKILRKYNPEIQEQETDLPF